MKTKKYEEQQLNKGLQWFFIYIKDTRNLPQFRIDSFLMDHENIYYDVTNFEYNILQCDCLRYFETPYISAHF